MTKSEDVTKYLLDTYGINVGAIHQVVPLEDDDDVDTVKKDVERWNVTEFEVRGGDSRIFVGFKHFFDTLLSIHLYKL